MVIGNILRIFGRMFYYIFRRGHGIFKILFVIDDFFRLFTMSIIIPLFFSWLDFSGVIVTLGFMLGVIIDVHDFVSEAQFAKFKS